MAAFNKFNTFSRDLAQGIHDFSSHTFKALLSNVAPSAANSVKADLTEIASGFGYAAGGPAVPMALSLSVATTKVTATDVVITAAGGSIGPFRYIAIYNDTSTGDRLIGWLDYGAALTLLDTETFTIDFDAALGLLTVV